MTRLEERRTGAVSRTTKNFITKNRSAVCKSRKEDAEKSENHDRRIEMDYTAAAKETHRTTHDEWLDGIAAQVQERQKEKERLMREKRNEKVEEYFPFGRPGCGAPIRSESGRLLTDYQERASMRGPGKVPKKQQSSPPPSRCLSHNHSKRDHNTSGHNSSRKHKYSSPSPPPPRHYGHHRSPSPPPPRHSGHHRSPSPPPRQYRSHHRSPSPPPPRHSGHHRSPSPPQYRSHRRRSPSPPPRQYRSHHRAPSPPPPRYSSHRRSPSPPPPRYHHGHRRSSSPPPPQYHDYRRSPSPQSPSPQHQGHHGSRLSSPSTYHRGTTNRPVHISMKSSIPFGPGCGREMVRHRTRKADNRDCRPNHGHTSGSHHQHKVSGPHYGRGAGPHVNEYVLQEKNDRTRKEEQHKDFLKQQILEKQRQKEEERLRKEREDREDEMRLQRERDQIEREIQRERQREKEKVEAAARKQELMQEKIRLASEAAVRAKEEAKREKLQNKAPDSYQHRPTASYHRSDDDDHYDQESVTSSNTAVYHEREVTPQAVKKSMNHKMAGVKNTVRTTTSRTQVESSKKPRATARCSRIPQRRKPKPDNKRSGKKVTFADSGVTTSYPRNSSQQSLRCKSALKKTSLPRLQRPASPPVPTVANCKKLAKSSQEPINLPRLQPLTSPPVPALARKMVKEQRSSQEPLNLPRLQPPTSPPVPAIARKLANSSQEPPKRQLCLPPIVEPQRSDSHCTVNHSDSAVTFSPGHTVGGGHLPPLTEQLDNRTNADLKIELQNHTQRLKEQELLIKMLLKEDQQRQQRQGDQQQILKQLASLKMGILQCKTKK